MEQGGYEVAVVVATVSSAVATIAAAVAACYSFAISRTIRMEQQRDRNKSKPFVVILDTHERRFTVFIRNDGPGPASDIHIMLAPAFEPTGQKTAALCHFFETKPANQPVPLGDLAPEEERLYAGYWDDEPPKRLQLSIIWTDGNSDRKGQNRVIDSGF